MKTDELLHLLAVDPPRRRRLFGPAGTALALGLLVSLLLLVGTIGMRHDLSLALHDPWVILKFAFAAGFAIAGIVLVRETIRPEGRRGMTLLLAPLLVGVFAAALVNLATTDSSLWRAAAMGDGPASCIALILGFSVPPTVLLFAALRQAAAPASSARAGAAIGTLGCAIGIGVFALNCPNDTAIFVALWYSLALALGAGIGALVGRRLLAW